MLYTEKTYWHIQLHNHNPKWNKEKELLQTESLIGLGALKEGDKQIEQFINEMKIGDIVLVRRGKKPIALVRIIGENETTEHNDTKLDWFEYRRKVEVLDYANNKMPSFPQPRGTLTKLINEKTKSYKFIYKWYIQIYIENLKEIDKKYLTKEDINILEGLLPKSTLVEIENVSLFFKENTIKHFNSLYIKKYKIFKEFKIDKLNRINIFAGLNNTGKTTLLEAVYLLTQQNNIGIFLNLVKLKNKLNKLDGRYLDGYFRDNIKISGIFNKKETKIEIEKFKAKDINKKNDYISSYTLISTISKEKPKNSTIHTFKSSSFDRYGDNIKILCNSLFKSPYFYNQDEVIETYSINLKSGKIGDIVSFIQKHLDNNIKYISHDGIDTFIVEHENNTQELTSYGEGLQRIFEIALSFAYCKNGVLLIDELETAIHSSLLVDFTKFIQELAVKFNVQVFVTTHSKECIDAFVNNKFKNNEINAYILKNIDGEIDYRYVTGDKLASLVESMNIDIRGKKKND